MILISTKNNCFLFNNCTAQVSNNIDLCNSLFQHKHTPKNYSHWFETRVLCNFNNWYCNTSCYDVSLILNKFNLRNSKLSNLKVNLKPYQWIRLLWVKVKLTPLYSLKSHYFEMRFNLMKTKYCVRVGQIFTRRLIFSWSFSNKFKIT